MKFTCPSFDIHDQELIQNAKITGKPEHVAKAIQVAMDGFRKRIDTQMEQVLEDGGIVLSSKIKASFFDHYAVSQVVQEIADSTGASIAVFYVGEPCEKLLKPCSPDIEFLP